jgi:branched-chain amino acid transport system substrate-binding protein
MKSAKAVGSEILSIDGVTTGTTDFRSLLTKIKGLRNVEAIYVGTVAMEGALIRDQMIKLGMNDLVMLGNTGIGNETFNKVAGLLRKE